MKKIISLGFVFVLCLMVVFTSCDPLTGGGSKTPAGAEPPAEPPAAPASITAVAGVEAVLVSWDASEGATAYSLYFTDDGSDPARSSTKIALGNVTTYTLPNLTWAKSGKTYIFAVAAVKSGAEGALSTVSNSIRPIPTIEVRFTGGTANAKMMLLVTPVNMDRTVTPPVRISFDTGVLHTGFTTDANGAVNLKAPFNREKSVGYTLMYDVDGSNSLSNGDRVQGDGDVDVDGDGVPDLDTWFVSYWNDLDESSFYCDDQETRIGWHAYLK